MMVYQSYQYALHNKNSLGPSFGEEKDLEIANHCDQNIDSKSFLGGTYKLPDGFNQYTPAANTLLAGSPRFSCDQYEVFILN